MNAQISEHSVLLGMFELDSAGTVLYSRPESGGAAATTAAPRPDLTGRNLFEEAAHFSNASELRRRVNLFRLSGAQADSFDFTCEYEDGPVPVRVLLARIRERSNYDTTKSVLVHVRRRIHHAPAPRTGPGRAD